VQLFYLASASLPKLFKTQVQPNKQAGFCGLWTQATDIDMLIS